MKSRLNPGKLRGVLVAAALLSASAPALAQSHDSDVPDAAFVFQRNVDTRAAEQPGTGDPSYVVLGGKDDVLSALGLEPMSDQEQAQVTGSLPNRGNTISDTVGASMRMLETSRSDGSASLAGERGNFVGGTISGAMSSVTSAMSALTNVLGGSDK